MYKEVARGYRSCCCSNEECRTEGCRLARLEAREKSPSPPLIGRRNANDLIVGMEVKLRDPLDASKLLRLIGAEVEIRRGEAGLYLVVGPLQDVPEWLGDQVG